MTCYSDHDEDVRTKGSCDYCGGTDPERMTTQEMTAAYEVVGFLAPYVVVKRRSDGKKGTLQFTHAPRAYFGWVED